MKDIRDWRIVGEEVDLVGKGPSFEKFKSRDVLSLGINQAMEVCDVGIALHIEPVLESWDCKKPLLVPYYPLHGGGSKHEKPITDWIDGDNVYGFHTQWCPGDGMVQSFGTTGHCAVGLLARKGVRDFTFYGIDGGRKVYGKQYYNERFKLDPKSYFESNIPADFDDMFRHYFQLRRKYGLSFRFV